MKIFDLHYEDTIQIGDDIKIKILTPRIKRFKDQASIGLTVPKHVRIMRAELLEEMRLKALESGLEAN